MYISSFFILALCSIQLVPAVPLMKRDCPPGTQLVFTQCTTGSNNPGCALPTYDPRYGYISLSCAPTGQTGQLSVPSLNGVLPDMSKSVPPIPALSDLIPLGGGD